MKIHPQSPINIYKKGIFIAVMIFVAVVISPRIISSFANNANKIPKYIGDKYAISDTLYLYNVKKYNDNYVIEYHTRNDKSIAEIFVGSSSVELERYIGQDVALRGKIRSEYGDVQCVLKRCHKISKDPSFRAIVIDIYGVN